MATVATGRGYRRVELREVMRRLDIDPAAGVLPQWSLSYFTALHRCETCPSKVACRDWLGHAPGATHVPPRFCPNADILFELQFDQLHHSPAPGRRPAALATVG